MTHMKAQDVFNASNPFLGKKCSFDEAFPEIDTIRVEYTESGVGAYSTRYKGNEAYQRVLGEKCHISEYINCSNPLCYNGGIHIGQVLREMVYNQETQKEDSKICQGNEGSPKGRKIYRKCYNYFQYKITISYKPIERPREE